ncbi:MAG TPA: hypothetical protein PLK77_15860 [Pyrinomonadaceae bacterium]|nr:hypothetical protein [Pyrinomonadaceae bacterium]
MFALKSRNFIATLASAFLGWSACQQQFTDLPRRNRSAHLGADRRSEPPALAGGQYKKSYQHERGWTDARTDGTQFSYLVCNKHDCPSDR